MERNGHLNIKRAVGAPGLRGGPPNVSKHEDNHTNRRVMDHIGNRWSPWVLLQRTDFGHLENG